MGGTKSRLGPFLRERGIEGIIKGRDRYSKERKAKREGVLEGKNNAK